MSGRVHKSVLNAEVNLIFYFITLVLAFFSRRIFLDCLGAEFIGLTGTLGNILGYLNLAELGITSCIGYFLFKGVEYRALLVLILFQAGYIPLKFAVLRLIVCDFIVEFRSRNRVSAY